MKQRNLVLGTIKKCVDLYGYQKYGEEREIGDFKTGGLEMGTIHRYVDVYIQKALLLKIDSGIYVYLNNINYYTLFLMTFGIYPNILSTLPSSENPFFVDEKTILNIESNDKTSIRRIRKLSGIYTSNEE